jgi:hypothetical protein
LRSEHNLKFKLRNITETSRKKLSSVGNVVWINSSSIDCHWSRVLHKSAFWYPFLELSMCDTMKYSYNSYWQSHFFVTFTKRVFTWRLITRWSRVHVLANQRSETVACQNRNPFYYIHLIISFVMKLVEN